MNGIAIKIVVDSTCALSREDQERLDVLVVPQVVHFGDETYLDGVDLTNEQFYDKLDQCERPPTTSQVSPEVFRDAFQGCLDAGDDVVGITLSSDLSGTYNSVRLAQESIGSDRLHIVDSRTVAMSLALLVSEAAKHRDAGCSAWEVVDHVKMLAKKVRFLAVVNMLKYLRKGGRISAASHVVGEALGMKPILSVVNGTAQAIGKARGMQAALKTIMQDVLANLPDLRYGVAFAHACAPELLEKAIACLKEPLKLTHWLVCPIGSGVGSYAGRGAIGFAYIAK